MEIGDFPLPEGVPPHLVNSLTLAKLHGDSVARFERSRSENKASKLELSRASWVKAGLTFATGVWPV
jgi:hypothetical protein